MTRDDESFVREIVGSPGDDTPRLVYADWLDDRDDPRGTYLRAELEWAQPWKTGYPPGWGPRPEGRGLPQWADDHWSGLDQLETAASDIDRVWVARVSRPPAGVCCDHVRFAQRPPLTDAHVNRAESHYGRPFPHELRAFLLNYNGGTPSRRQVVIRSTSEEGAWDRLTVASFAWVRGTPGPETGGPHEELLDALRDDLEYFETELDGFTVPNVATDYVPIGQVHSNSLLLMRLADPPTREVFVLFMEDAGAPEPLTRSLPELLARIVTDPI